MFKLGIITDEMSQNLEEALAFSSENGLDCYELRSAWEKGPFELDDEDFDIIAELTKKYGLPLVSISSPMYKCSISDIETRNAHIEGLKKLIEKSEMLEVRQIRCFDFLKEDNITQSDISKAFEEPLKLCSEAGITLLLEPEPSANSSTCKKTAETVRYINHPNFKALYEPGNMIYTPGGDIPYPDGYDCMKDIFCHIHIKDAVVEDGNVRGVAIGSGLVDYKGIFTQLINTGYSGAVVLEPHYKIGGTISAELMHNPKGSAFSENGFASCKECIDAVHEIINSIK